MGPVLRTVTAALLWSTWACDPGVSGKRDSAELDERRRFAAPKPRPIAEKPQSSPAPSGDERDEVPAHTRPASLRLGYARPVPQTLACGPLGFVHLTEHGFDAYSYATLGRILRYRQGQFTHVVDQPGYSFLLVGPGSSLLYYQANHRLTALAHLPALGPLHLWPDAQKRERLWLHYLKDDAVHHFELPRRVNERARLLSSVGLEGYRGGGLTRLAAGQWIYVAHTESDVSTLRVVEGSRRFWLSPSSSADSLVAGSSGEFWSIDAAHISRFEFTPLGRLRPSDVKDAGGEVWAAVSEGGRLAFLAQTTDGARRRWALGVRASNGWHAVELPNLTGRDEPAAARDLTLCLVPNRPWVVWGGREEVRVLDFETGELAIGGR